MWGLASSCISEDYSDCSNRYVVNLSYVGDGTKEIFLDKIGSAQMYIFDGKSSCIYQAALREDEIAHQQTMLPPLEEGDYHIVFVANPYDTEIKDISTRTSLSDLCFGAESYWAGRETSGNDSLYWAALDQKIEAFVSDRPVTYSTAYFASSHYDVSVEIVGAPSVPTIVLKGVSPYTDFDNVATAAESADYVLDAKHDGFSTVIAGCNILRHQNHESVYLKVLGADGDEMVSINFAEFLRENKEYIDCSKNEVLIPFKIEFRSLSDVEVTVPDWLVTHVKPDFG